jgi:2'-5' RNA ligase
MRLFLAIAPDRPAGASLGRRLIDVQDAIGDEAQVLKWTPATNVHITLQFLGEVAPSRVPGLVDALGPTLDEPSFEIALGPLGVFPAAGAPRVLWLDVIAGSAPLVRVHEAIGRRLADAGFSVEARPLSPHATIARVPDRERARVKQLRERVHALESRRSPGEGGSIAWMAERVILFRSDLSGPVPRYEGMHDIELATGAVNVR